MSDEKQEGATPGPWWVEDTDRGPLIIGAGNEHLATVNNYYRVAERNIANARLISAAPDMLAALKLFEMKEERLLSAQGEYLTVRIPVSAFQARAAAIDKATTPTIGAAVKKG